MKKFITMFIRHWAKAPLKVVLTLLSVSLGTGILILSFSASSILKDKVSNQLEKNGVIMYVANGKWASDGTIDQTRPPQWNSTAIPLVVTDIDAVTKSAPILRAPIREIEAGGTTYQLRSAIGSSPSYFDIFSLKTIAGVPMTDNDVASGLKRVWINSETASILFGSPQKAIGQWVKPPGRMFQGEGRERNMITQYVIAGVFESPSEISRKSYGIGDLIVPYTSFVPAGGNVNRMLDFMSGLFVVNGKGASTSKISSSIHQLLSGHFGADIDVTIWEGSPQGTSTYMEELRQAVSIFTVSVNILGIVLLITGSLGIFSIMVVEALGRRRDIALERAIGASQGIVIREFWSWSIVLSLLGALLGVALAAVFARPVLGTISPLIGEISARFKGAAGIRFSTVITGLALALGCGGVLGLLPAISAVKGNIAETLREG